ncbi:PREDICTED: kinesin-like calmodulin-binding protein isoform X3 [Cyprinodon variegatus]|uniref:kinesin-like calmodulin-binding protein isoform X3 n=1 Tax=Cyprinodon variegatus TaxID=28743 RepID=UPI000742B85C|nr:PREDICTED: kinesin-like calmodulin-binding protein isoform X3 [Cyprinodon variegatus]
MHYDIFSVFLSLNSLCLLQQPPPCPAQDIYHHKNVWTRRWAAFRRWIGADRRKRNGRDITAGSSESQLGFSSDAREAESSQHLKIYIPYESAELCIAQIVEDMKVMKKRHLQTVQELEANFQTKTQESQEWIKQKVTFHYQNKLNTLRRFLEVYRNNVEKKKADWEKKVTELTAQNEQLLVEQRVERRRWKEEALQWQEEKSKMLELFSSRLDIMHCHQASTLHELQMARQEIGQVQEMLTVSSSQEPHESAEEEQGSDESSLSFLQEAVRECEVCQIALDCLRTGESPVLNDCEMSELEDVVGQETLSTSQRSIKVVGHQLLLLQDQLKREKEEKKKVIENYTTERAMRKKYYNMVEEMKGKIRVFCRIRPVNRSEATQGGAIVVDKLDDYSVSVETLRGLREFQFDKVFSAEASQEDLFQDVNRLMQSVIDGFNVCIFAYGQTGSGKTFTMVGDKDQKNPGIMPRSFNAIFNIMQENTSKFDFKVSAYMLELYNDRLQDLFVSQTGEAHAQTQPHGPTRRVEIKRNRKGVVFAQGAETKEASSAQELYALFQQACANRHISATKMNVESSRSHLIVGIMVESRNLTNGSVNSGKLSLVDLAGSERAAKTGAKDHQLKEANSINKSLSALGDVISALSAELPHVPYRNSKLTQVMQDSLGGNAKTLMIVNISPSEHNLEETITSLIYATRVKAITNNAQRNVDSKEIAQLKEVIMKLKSGQTVEEVDV